MSRKTFSAIILAAGQGKRMKSPLPKVLHPVAGYPLLQRVIQAVKDAGAQEIRVVVGHGESLVRKLAEPWGVVCHTQEKPLGTADAVRAAQPSTLNGTVVILNGDHPLVEGKDIRSLLEEHWAGHNLLSVVSAVLKNPGQYGRIVRHKSQLRAIVEAKDASSETLKIKEVNTGMYIVDADILNEYLPRISSVNAQNEFYLTDIVSLCQESGVRIDAICGPKTLAFGVNTQKELARSSQLIFRRKANRLMEEGVVIIDPTNVYIEDEVRVGEGTVIYPGVFLKGRTRVGRFCVLEPNSFVNSCDLAESVQIKSGSYLENAKVGQRSVIGPYAHLRPETEVGEDCKVGNFVEMKKVFFANRAKASHLTYLGDAVIGEDTNIGCGTITCNYAPDKKKYVTKIGKNVFVGSDTQFVAPVEVGDNSVIASGSTITENVPEGALAIARSRQSVKPNYQKKS